MGKGEAMNLHADALTSERGCAGTSSNKSVIPTASVLMPLDYGYPMQIFPGVTFSYGMCARGAPSAYLRVDLMSVPSLRMDNASAYAIHLWTKVTPAYTSFNVSHRLWSVSVRVAAEDTACFHEGVFHPASPQPCSYHIHTVIIQLVRAGTIERSRACRCLSPPT